MPALTEHRTRELLGTEKLPMVKGTFLPRGEAPEQPLPVPAYLKAQIPGATSRASKGLVRLVEEAEDLSAGLSDIQSKAEGTNLEGVLVTEPVDLYAEYYAACTLELGGEGRPAGGLLLFSPRGGSGVEERADSLVRIGFSLQTPPSAARIEKSIPPIKGGEGLCEFLQSMVSVFCRFKLLVLEVNPIGVTKDGNPLVVDCRAEYETRAVPEDQGSLFGVRTSRASDLTSLERTVERINREDPSGTGFFRQNREPAPEGSWKVATNLCGGGGKMLWEMATGDRRDLYALNESDTSGGLSAFKSYRILRVILSQENAQVLLLTGSGMAFQNQHHLAAAVWKALRESPTPLPSLLRFGGTDEDLAHSLFERVSASLPTQVRHYPATVFPNAMVDDIPEVAADSREAVDTPPPPPGDPVFSVENPPGDFYFYPERCDGKRPGCLDVCPTGFLQWDRDRRTLVPSPDARCIGCLMCETHAILEGNSELLIHLRIPWETAQ